MSNQSAMAAKQTKAACGAGGPSSERGMAAKQPAEAGCAAGGPPRNGCEADKGRLRSRRPLEEVTAE